MKVNGYLTESKLHAVLSEWAGDTNVAAQVKVAGTRMRSDFEVRREGTIYVVEFEGDTHYRDANVIYRDNIKAGIQKGEGKKVVKIPYFVQLTSQTFEHFFESEFDVESDFPHGFITTKVLPASFCPIGYAAAKVLFEALPNNVRDDILGSLKEKARELPAQYVFFSPESERF